MEAPHSKKPSFWDKSVALPVPETNLSFNLEVSALRYPSRTAIHYYGAQLSYAELKQQVDALAGYLQQDCEIQRGDRVVLFMQNSPQFVIAYYAILRADAVVVPVNPMNLADELRHYIEDSGAKVAITASELLERVEPHLTERRLHKAVVAAYGDYIKASTDLEVPDVVTAQSKPLSTANAVAWPDALAANRAPAASKVTPDDMAAMPYTSGTTGKPKGCIHTHRTLMSTLVSAGLMNGQSSADVMLAAVPFFHVTGMQMVMANALYLGAELVVMTRWDRELALDLIERHRVTSWINIPTMVVDLLASPRLTAHSLRSLKSIGGGGAAMPEAIATRLFELTGLGYIEGYGLTETAAPTHSNPPSRPKRQCLGKPIFNTHSRIIDQESGDILGPNQIGEIVTKGPQVFKGYWNNLEATKASFIEIDGETYFRTGDLATVDDEGYFFMVDRLKRMINASGYKVWPAEVESLMYQHPGIQEVCVIGSRDAHRGETVKAIVVPKAGSGLTEQDVLAWSKQHMASYKAPRIVQLVDVLPKTATGKVQWRVLQETEDAKPA